MPIDDSRSAKHIGDFGEGLVSYAFISSGYEVVKVDHVGADLIARKDDGKGTRTFAISVKTRHMTNSKESECFVFTDDNIAKLQGLSDKFDFEPVVSIVISQKRINTIHMFTISLKNLMTKKLAVKLGYQISFSAKKLRDMIDIPGMKYSCWTGESISVVD